MMLPDRVVIGRKETHITGKNTKQDGAHRDSEEAKSFPDCANTTFFFSLSMNKIGSNGFIARHGVRPKYHHHIQNLVKSITVLTEHRAADLLHRPVSTEVRPSDGSSRRCPSLRALSPLPSSSDAPICASAPSALLPSSLTN